MSVFISWARAAIAGQTFSPDIFSEMAALPLKDVMGLVTGAHMIRQHHFRNTVALCTICNAKSGRCSEDCGFCAQSAHARTDVAVYPLQPEEVLRKGADFAEKHGIHRYSLVTSGRGLPASEVGMLAEMYEKWSSDVTRTGFCASLGILGPEELSSLRASGVTRYHHNLETAESHFGNICTTHSFAERVETIRAAKAAGMSVCSGGLFGIGETDAQVIEMALTLKELDVDAVPVNFLVPVKGTVLGGLTPPDPLRCLKIIAIFRYLLPDKDILVCGGRETALKELHPMVFWAGASGIMTGNYLTVSGRSLEDDLALIRDMGFVPRPEY